MLNKTNRNRGARGVLEINEVISQSDQSLVSGVLLAVVTMLLAFL